MNKKIILLALFISGISAAQQNRQILFSNKNQKQVSCYRIPSIITAPDGTLIAAADQRVPSCGDLIWNKNINLVIRTSKDEGKTWTDISTIVDLPEGESASDPSMVVDRKTKEIFMFYNYMNLNIPGKEFRFHVIKSADNGKSWSTPMDITDAVAPKEWKSDFKFITSGRGFQTKKGWLLNTLVHLKEGVYVIGSKDHGKTWTRFPGLAKMADETNIVELSDKSWLLNARVRDLGYRKFYISKDNGNSWTEHAKKDLIDPACNASTLVFNKKTILFSNLHDTKNRKNLGIKISKDQGKTWDMVQNIEKGSTAYSVLTPITKSKVGILYEADDYKDIIFESIDIR